MIQFQMYVLMNYDSVLPVVFMNTLHHIISKQGVPFEQLQLFQAEDIKQDYDTGKDDITMVTFRMDYDKIDSLENAINSSCGRKFDFYKQ